MRCFSYVPYSWYLSMHSYFNIHHGPGYRILFLEYKIILLDKLFYNLTYQVLYMGLIQEKTSQSLKKSNNYFTSWWNGWSYSCTRYW